jgi:SPP1 gp7 family putative phage head morphogenesis protein
MIETFYHETCCRRPALPDLEGDPDEELAAAVADMVNQVWLDQGLPESTINIDVTKAFADKLWAGVIDGYGKDAVQIDYDTPDGNMLRALRTQTFHFSGAKNYHQLRELTVALIGEDGRLRTKDQFIEAALKINDRQVKRYLKPEYELAVAGSQMAGKWVDIERDKETLPLLRFDAVIDGQTSDLCRSLHGTTLPVDHPFWDRFYPTNHFGCRSTVRQLRTGSITPESKIPSADIPPMFQTNLAKNRLVFPPDHPYFQDLPADVLRSAERLI